MTTDLTISERVTEMHAVADAQPPDEVMNAFRREQADLAVTGLPAEIAPVGTVVADTDLLDPYGNATTLYDATADATTILVFHRGAWCPYCNIALATYQVQLLPQLTERGVTFVALSPQAPDGSLTMAEKHHLAYPVLSDPGNTVATQLGILTAPSADALASQHQLGLELTTVNVDKTTTLPMPTTVIIDAEHLLRWIDVHPDYSTRSETREILDALDQLAR